MRRFLNLLVITIIGVTVLISCKKDNNDPAKNTCNVSNPAEELGWLKKEIDSLKNDEYSFYVMANYKGETVFINENCNPLIDYMSLVKNCKGDILGYTHVLNDDLSDKTIIWKHEKYKCTF